MTNSTFDPTGGLPPEADYCMLEQPEGTTHYGENHAFWFFDDDNKAHSYNHVDAIQHFYELRTERNWLMLEDGRVLYNWSEGRHTTKRQAGGSCLKFTCIEPFRRWSVDYLGTMRVSSAEELAKARGHEGPRAIVEYHVDVETGAEPWKQGKGYAYGDTRYEQLYRHTGYVKTSLGDDFKIAGMGVRTHRRGPRIMSNWHGHCWETALFPSGRGFALKRFASEDGPKGWPVPKWSEACVIDQGRVIPAEVIESAWLSHMKPRGEAVRVRLRSALGDAEITGVVMGTSWRTMHLNNVDTNHRSFGVWGEPGEYIMGQGACRWSWDGESVIGQIERSVITEHLDKSDLAY